MKHRDIGLLSIGHLVTDINQGALPAMLPFLSPPMTFPMQPPQESYSPLI